MCRIDCKSWRYRRHMIDAIGPLLQQLFPIVVIIILFGNSLVGQETTKPVTAQFDANDRCLNCHTQQPQVDGKPSDFVEQTPAKTWDADDKHRLSFQLLQQNRELVTRIIGFELDEVIQEGEFIRNSSDPDWSKKRTQVEHCLRCHATWPKGYDEPPVDLRLGVSCQACHGPGRNWDLPHSEKWWRLCRPEAKARLGMFDLRNVVQRARLCGSCHFGDWGSGKFVTHSMYANGHPPLPGIEVAEFTMKMPRHWKSLREKGRFDGRDRTPRQWSLQAVLANHSELDLDADDFASSYLTANYEGLEHDPASDLTFARETIVGGLALARGQVQLVKDYFEDESANTTITDFALFECRACHHELRPRLELSTGTKLKGRIGRPSLAAWPQALATLAIPLLQQDARQAGDPESEYESLHSGLEDAITRRPFGADRQSVVSAADSLLAWYDPKLNAIQRTAFDEDAVFSAYRALLNRAATAGMDFHSARQLAWAGRILHSELRGMQPAMEHYSDLSKQLRLELPFGQQRHVTQFWGPYLDAIEDFQAQGTQNEFQAIQDALLAP